MHRRRMLVVSDVFPPRPGGSGRWLWEVYRHFDPAEVTVVAGATDGAAQFDRDAGMSILRTHPRFSTWGLRALPTYLRLARDIAAAARDGGAGVVHCGKCLPEGLAALFARVRTGLPYWCYVHGEELTLARTSRELNWLTGLVLGRAERIVANSEHSRALVARFWPAAASRVVVLHPGVDTTRFVPAPPDAAVRERLGWTGRRVMLTVGALQRRKGQDMVIRALPAIRRDCPDVLYVMAGEGWERPALEALARDLDVTDLVQFAGAPADRSIVELFQQCDLFVLANRQVGWDFEGFGIVLLEAQACGKPVIAGASGGTIETVQPGVTGDVVACERPEPLAAACTALLENAERRAAYARAARLWVVEHFGRDVVGRRAEAVIG